MMRRRLALATGAVALATAPGAQAAPSTHTAIGIASAMVIRPLSVVATADMDFGTITHQTGTGGTVTVTPGSSGATFSGGAGAVCAGSDCDLAHAARFAVSGEPQRGYTIQLPTTVIASGAATDAATVAPPLTVNRLTMHTTSGGATPRLDASGADGFEIGGTITLPADLPPARYRASFAVVVTYS